MPSKPVRYLLFACTLLFAVPPTPASAAIIQVEVATTINLVLSNAHTLPMMVGDDVVLRFQYDDAVPDQNPFAGTGQFQNAVVQASVEFPDQGLSFEFPLGASSAFITVDNEPDGAFTTDLASFVSFGDPVTGDMLDGDTPNSLVFTFLQSVIGVPDLVVDDRINPPFSFNDVEFSVISLAGPIGTTGQSFIDVFQLDPGTATILPVPEPQLAALLVGTALALLRRRRP